MKYTGRLTAAFILSILVHLGVAWYLDRTPWMPGGALEGLVSPQEQYLSIQMVSDADLYQEALQMGGDPQVQEQALKRTLEQEVDQAPQAPEIPQEEWFSPEPVAIEAPQEDLLARLDTELSNLPGLLEADSVETELLKVPEPKVEAPSPDTRVWAPALQEDTPPPSVSSLPAPIPLPAPTQAALPDLPALPEIAPPPVDEVIPQPLASAPALELPKDIFVESTEEIVGEPESVPDTQAEFKEWDDFLDVEISAYRPDTDRGYFRVSLTPNKNSSQLLDMSKDILYAIDASGSMEGAAFNGIREAIAGSLDHLRKGDRFNIIGFRDNVVALNSGLWPVNEKTIHEAKDFVLDLEPSGKTDIYSSITSIVRSLPSGDRPFSIIVCTDGRSTVGLQDSREIINALSIENKLRAAIHVFGPGEGANRYLLRLLAYRNKGIARFSNPGQSVKEALEKFFIETADPILVNVQVDLSGMAEKEAYPLILPDLYRSGRLTFYGRFDTEKELALRLTGDVRGNRKEFVYRGDLPDPEKGNKSIAEAWAFSKAFNIVSDNLEFGPTPERVKTLRELAKTYGLDVPRD